MNVKCVFFEVIQVGLKISPGSCDEALNHLQEKKMAINIRLNRVPTILQSKNLAFNLRLNGGLNYITKPKL